MRHSREANCSRTMTNKGGLHNIGARMLASACRRRRGLVLLLLHGPRRRSCSTWSRQGDVGLYGYPQLISAKGFPVFAEEAIGMSKDLICEMTKVMPSLETIRLFDDVSNVICSVVDCAELCRNTHPDKEYVFEASEASMKLHEYLQCLNSNTTLYNALLKAKHSGLLISDESRRAVEMLCWDIERGGIDLCEGQIRQGHDLSLQISSLEREFLANISKDPGCLEIYPADRFPKHMQHLVQPVFKLKDGIVTTFWRPHWNPKDYISGFRVIMDSGLLNALLKTTEDAEVRKKVYMTGYSSPKCNLHVLENLIGARHEMAKLLGCRSYAELSMVSTMAASPKVVDSFLMQLSKDVRAKADEEQRMLRNFCSEFEKRRIIKINPWDDAYYINLMKVCLSDLDSQVVASFFPLVQCIKGLDLMAQSLFGATLKQVSIAPGEAWHPCVEKFALRHSTEGDLGYLYLDLHKREGKYPGAAHFPIRSGKRVSENHYQLPVVALVCNFSSLCSTSSPLLTHNDVQVLFHEFGHAMHSLLSRTELHQFSGTRTTVDFAEIPSHIFEYYAWDYRVISKFARHHETGDIMPRTMFETLCLERNRFAASELQRQVLFAIIDQAFFGEKPLSAADTISTVSELTFLHTGQEHLSGTHWHTRFSHLINYGAAYYSYLNARSFAASIWHKICIADPLSPEVGHILRKHLLEYGGSKDPALILEECAGKEFIMSHSGGGISPCTNALLREL